MSGTTATVTTLYSQFPDNGPPGNIVPARYRNIVASFPPWDDPANAIGLGAPAILRGTINAEFAAGVTMGSGQTTLVRQATAAGLMAAWQAAIANNKFFELPPGIYEIDTTTATQLSVTNTSFTNCLVWRGSPMSRIIQFNQASTGTPVIYFGDPAGNTYTFHLDVHGGSFEYGNSQAGLTNTANVVIASALNCKIDLINAGAGSNANPAYFGVRFIGTAAPEFSSSFYDWTVNGAQVDMIHMDNISTGSVAGNWYCNLSNGTLTGGTSGGSFLYMAGATFVDGIIFDEINFEHGSTPTVMYLQLGYGNRFGTVHIEGVTLTGFNPQFIRQNGGNVSIDCLDMQNCIVNTASMSGTASLVWTYAPGGGNLNINNLNLINQSTSQINAPLVMVTSSNNPASAGNNVRINKALLFDQAGGNYASNLSIDTHLPVASFNPPTQFSTYEFGLSGSSVTGAFVPVSAAYTHYGQHDNVTYVLAATGSYNLTLADTMGATGTQLPRPGSTVNVVRPSYSSGTVLVKDGAGSTLTTNTGTTATQLCYVHNGTHYVAVTPVT